ncbi:hypothetical protein K501DRAFT_282606 [Backusella circina FSU 941]|nr:hypothetical protein K501DRAFT_282606 [Backusella circina FSU 941]
MLFAIAVSQFLINMIAATSVCKGLIYGNTTEPTPFEVTEEDPCFIFPAPINTSKIEIVEGNDPRIYAFGKADCADELLRRSLNPLEFDPAKVAQSVIVWCQE